MNTQKQVLVLLSKMVINQAWFNIMPLEDRWWVINNLYYAIELLVISIRERDKIKKAMTPMPDWIKKESRKVIRNNLKLPEIVGGLVAYQKELRFLSVEDITWASKNPVFVIRSFIDVIRNKDMVRKIFIYPAKQKI